MVQPLHLNGVAMVVSEVEKGLKAKERITTDETVLWCTLHTAAIHCDSVLVLTTTHYHDGIGATHHRSTAHHDSTAMDDDA